MRLQCICEMSVPDLGYNIFTGPQNPSEVFPLKSPTRLMTKALCYWDLYFRMDSAYRKEGENKKLQPAFQNSNKTVPNSICFQLKKHLWSTIGDHQASPTHGCFLASPLQQPYISWIWESSRSHESKVSHESMSCWKAQIH